MGLLKFYHRDRETGCSLDILEYLLQSFASNNVGLSWEETYLKHLEVSDYSCPWCIRGELVKGFFFFFPEGQETYLLYPLCNIVNISWVFSQNSCRQTAVCQGMGSYSIHPSLFYWYFFSFFFFAPEREMQFG